MAGRVDGSQRVNISRAVIEGNAVDLLLPLGTVTTVTPAWTEPLGAVMTVTPARTAYLGAALLLPQRGLYHWALWARLRPLPQRGLYHWARLRPLPQRGLDLGWDWILPKPAVFTELKRMVPAVSRVASAKLLLMYATPASMVSAKIAPVSEYFAPAPVTIGTRLPTCHAELFSH